MKKNQRPLKYIFGFLYLFLLSFQGFSQDVLSNEVVKQSLFQKLGDFQKLVILTDLDSMLLSKRTEDDQTAIISFYGENQSILKLKAKIKARGKFRRTKCDIPPLKLNFSKSELAEKGLQSKFDKFKLVGHCLMDGSAITSVLKEHCIYKMHNYISDYSFRVKSFTIIYQHNTDPTRIIRGEGFLLEPNKEMAARNGGKLIDRLGATNDEVTPESYHHLLLFNFMIGNTDWSIEQQRNIKLLKKEGEEKMIIVPYDFDNCGLVNPPYLYSFTENKKVKGDNRIVAEKFHDKEALYQELKFFQALERYHLTACLECEKLRDSDKRKMIRYLKPFFKSVKNIKKMQSLFLEK